VSYELREGHDHRWRVCKDSICCHHGAFYTVDEAARYLRYDILLLAVGEDMPAYTCVPYVTPAQIRLTTAIERAEAAIADLPEGDVQIAFSRILDCLKEIEQ